MGECFVLEEYGNIELEYWYCYLQVCELVVGKDVLDIVSGEGYGFVLIVEVVCQVMGVDIVLEVVVYVSVCYQCFNLCYLEGNCVVILLFDYSVDLIVSFEIIEYYEQYEEMMCEFKCVLCFEGLLLIFNFDKYFYLEVLNYSNLYYVKEFYEQEFKQLFLGWYKNICYFG